VAALLDILVPGHPFSFFFRYGCFSQRVLFLLINTPPRCPPPGCISTLRSFYRRGALSLTTTFSFPFQFLFLHLPSIRGNTGCYFFERTLFPPKPLFFFPRQPPVRPVVWPSQFGFWAGWSGPSLGEVRIACTGPHARSFFSVFACSGICFFGYKAQVSVGIFSVFFAPMRNLPLPSTYPCRTCLLARVFFRAQVARLLGRFLPARFFFFTKAVEPFSQGPHAGKPWRPGPVFVFPSRSQFSLSACSALIFLSFILKFFFFFRYAIQFFFWTNALAFFFPGLWSPVPEIGLFACVRFFRLSRGGL